MHELQEEYLVVVRYDVKSYGDLFRLKLRLQQVDEELCKAQQEMYRDKIIAIVHRNDDVEEKWVVAPEGMTFTKEEIREQIHFQEQYFDSEIVM